MLATAGPRSVMKQVATPMFRPAVIARMNVAPRVGVVAFHTTKKMQIFPAGPRECSPYSEAWGGWVGQRLGIYLGWELLRCSGGSLAQWGRGKKLRQEVV